MLLTASALQRAALWALLWLLASRMLGLLRESALAASLGAGAEADVALLVISLPDTLVSLMAGGALSLLLLPAWAPLSPADRWALQQRALRVTTVGCGLVALTAAVLTPWLWPLLAAGAHSTPMAVVAWGLALLACPLAMASAVWATRCQAQADMTGLYVGNLLFNLLVVLALGLLVLWPTSSPKLFDASLALPVIGAAVVAACVARLVWAWFRVLPLRPSSPPVGEADSDQNPASSSPSAGVVLSAVVATAVPLLLPFAARSAASDAGAGALAVFGYAWKLVELPWVLGVQVIATVAFARVAQVVGPSGLKPEALGVLRRAFGVALMVAAVAALALGLAAEWAANGLFAWGRMAGAETALASVAQQARVGALALPALAIVAVASTVIAAAGHLRGFAWAAGVVVVVFFALLSIKPAGSSPMMALVAAQWLLAFMAARQVLGIIRRSPPLATVVNGA